MRYVVHRISPWSAAKVGAVVGILHGVVVGLLVSAAGSVAAPYLAQLDQPVISVGWAAVALIGLFVASTTAIVCALAAVVYNLAGWLGAGLVVDLSDADKSAMREPAGKPAAGAESPEAAFLQGEMLNAE